LLQVESEGDVPAEVSSQVEAVNEESVNESSASEKKVVRLLSLINQRTKENCFKKDKEDAKSWVRKVKKL
jgi:hypothetical protein